MCIYIYMRMLGTDIVLFLAGAAANAAAAYHYDYDDY